MNEWEWQQEYISPPQNFARGTKWLVPGWWTIVIVGAQWHWHTSVRGAGCATCTALQTRHRRGEERIRYFIFDWALL